jgi:AcrR family transcriptional regulator
MPRPALVNRAEIAAKALSIIDEEGLEALSMRRLADALGIRAASLYRHVATKDDLLHTLANEIMAGVEVSGFQRGWRTGLSEWAHSYRNALAAHPNLIPFAADGPARREASLRAANAVHGGLTGAGWPPRHATMIGAAVKYLVVGAAMGSFARGFEDDEAVYAVNYPHLRDAPALRQHATEIDADSFDLALDSFLDGLQARYEALPSRVVSAHAEGAAVGTGRPRSER